jgi:hypothetical protein
MEVTEDLLEARTDSKQIWTIPLIGMAHTVIGTEPTPCRYRPKISLYTFE